MKETETPQPSLQRMTKAELSVRLLALQMAHPEDSPSAPEERELQTVLHELEVYQIELEMQVHELRESREELESSHERYVNLYDFAPVGYVSLSERGLIQEINLTAARLLGVERNWLLNRSLATWVLGSDLPVFRQHLKQCRESEGKVLSSFHLVSQEKQAVPVEISSVRMLDAQSGQVVFRTAVTDLSDRKVYEQKLTLERHKLNTIFRESPASMALLRGDNLVFEMINAEYQSLFAQRDLLGRPLLEALPEFASQPFYALLQNVLKTGVPYRGHEMPASIFVEGKKELEEHFFDFTYTLIQNEDRRPYGVYIHSLDVTDRVIARRNLEESRAKILEKVSELEEERELRERFVDALSHDLRTPLTATKLSAILLQRVHREPEELRAIGTKICQNIDRADQMISNLLDASRLKGGEKIPLKIEYGSMQAIIVSALEALKDLYGNRLNTDFKANIEGWWDQDALTRMLENLASNAVKYGAPKAEILFSLRKDGDVAVIAVHNKGNPIPEKEIPKLFQRFHRSTSAENSSERGWGIGLALVKGLVEAHRGTIQVNSSFKEGTTFTIRIPIDARKKKST